MKLIENWIKIKSYSKFESFKIETTKPKNIWKAQKNEKIIAISQIYKSRISSFQLIARINLRNEGNKEKKNTVERNILSTYEESNSRQWKN